MIWYLPHHFEANVSDKLEITCLFGVLYLWIHNTFCHFLPNSVSAINDSNLYDFRDYDYKVLTSVGLIALTRLVGNIVVIIVILRRKSIHNI